MDTQNDVLEKVTLNMAIFGIYVKFLECTLEVKDLWKNSPTELLIINPYSNNGLFQKTIYCI